MPMRPTEAQEKHEAEIYQMSLSGLSVASIASKLNTTERSVHRALHNARKSIRESRARKGQDKDLARYESDKRHVIDECWRRVDTLPSDSRTAAELLATISTTADGIAKAQGLFVVRHDVTTGGKSLDEALNAILSSTVTFAVPDDANPFPDGG